MECPHCCQEHTDDIRFCPVTGKQIIIPEICPQCGKVVEAKWSHCGFCGQSLIRSEIRRKNYGDYDQIPNSSSGLQKTIELSSKSFRMLFFLGLVGLFIVAGFGFYFFLKVNFQNRSASKAGAFWTSTSSSAFRTTPVLTSTRTITPHLTSTMTFTPIASETSTITLTSPPKPAAVVINNNIDVYEGPGTEFINQGSLKKNEELDIIGQFENCSWIKINSRFRSLSGWISTEKKNVDLKIDCKKNIPGTFRPLTGTIKRFLNQEGSGKLFIVNATSKDVVVLLTEIDKPELVVYIRLGQSFTMERIVDGIYNIYFSAGSEWNGKEFTINPSYEKIDHPYEFKTNVYGYAQPFQYTKWSAILRDVAQGNATMQEVDKSKFPVVGE